MDKKIKKNFRAPSEQAIQRMISVSQNYNSPEDHYEIIMQLTTLDADAVSFIIGKAEEKNEYGSPLKRLNSKNIRNINVGISTDPLNYKEFGKSKKDKAKLDEKQWHREKFILAIKREDFVGAMLHYITLTSDLNDSEFKEECESKKEKLSEFFKLLTKINGGKNEKH